MRDRIWTRLRNSALVVILVGMTGEVSQCMAQGAQATSKLERGRVLVLELQTTIDSEWAKVGDHVTLRLVQPVKNTAGDDLLPAGWIVPAHVTKVHHAGKSNCRNGSVSWELDTAKAPDGTPVKLKLLSWRAVGPNGLLAEKVEVKTAGQKFENVLEHAALVPVFVIELPIVIPLVIGEGSGVEPCHGKPGSRARVRTGTEKYAAVAKDVRVSLARVPVTDAPSPD
jgi:hypothetical protein